MNPCKRHAPVYNETCAECLFAMLVCARAELRAIEADLAAPLPDAPGDPRTAPSPTVPPEGPYQPVQDSVTGGVSDPQAARVAQEAALSPGADASEDGARDGARVYWCATHNGPGDSCSGPGCETGWEIAAAWYADDGRTVMLPAPEVERRRKLAAKAIGAAREVNACANGMWGVALVKSLDALDGALAALDALAPSAPSDGAREAGAEETSVLAADCIRAEGRGAESVDAVHLNRNAPACTNFVPPWFTGRWRDWHRGHGCDKDDGRSRTPEGKAEIEAGGAAETAPDPAPHQMDAVDGPVCSCGRPSAHESGWCGICRRAPPGSAAATREE